MSAVYIQAHFRLDFFMQANNMNPDQIAPKGEILKALHNSAIRYCLQYLLSNSLPYCVANLAIFIVISSH